MSKILLVTIQNNCNFGNRLQNYALQTLLEKKGFQVDNLTLKNIKLADMSISLSNRISVLIRRIMSSVFHRYRIGTSVVLRRFKCAFFSQKRIHNYLMLSRNELNDYNFEEYAAVITGSDQVWHNWNRIPDELAFYYLDYIDKERRIAYAPSFGFDRFPEPDIELHKNGILGIRSLSCREKDGCDLIFELTGRKAECVLDPTLLLSVEDWKKIEKRPSGFHAKKYLLQFMLGETTSEYEREIKHLSDQFEAEIVNINDRNMPQYYGISPDEFIWLIHHAEVVCTDSFHATVFSILFTKNIRVFKRVAKGFENMFGRLDSLLSPLGLNHVVFDPVNVTPTSTQIDNTAVMYLEIEKRKSINFLLDSIHLIQSATN